MRYVFVFCLTLASCTQPANILTSPPPIGAVAVDVDQSSFELVQVERNLSEIATSGETAAPQLEHWAQVRTQGSIVGVNAVLLAGVASTLRDHEAQVSRIAAERDQLHKALNDEKDARAREQAAWTTERAALHADIESARTGVRQRGFALMVIGGCAAAALGVAMLWFKPMWAVPLIAFGLSLIGLGRFLEKWSWLLEIVAGAAIAAAIVWACVLVVRKHREGTLFNKRAADYRHAASQLVRELEKFVRPLLSPEQWATLLRDLRSHQTEVTKAIVDELRVLPGLPTVGHPNGNNTL